MSSDSSAPTTPMVLTPDSTGADSSDSIAAAKKARRQTAFYPNMNSSNKPLKPFSRSAAKRESVMALGSIEHLQHYFTKTGIAAKKKPSTKNSSGFVPAIGGLSHIPANPSLDGLPEFALPPSPAVPTITGPAFPTIKTYETNPDSLLPGVIDDLAAVARAWQIAPADSSSQDPALLGAAAHASPAFDVLDVLKTTTHAVRSVRNYVLALPDESAGTLRAQFRSKLLEAVPAPRRLAAAQRAPADALALIRRAALDVLTVLRALEEAARVPLSDEAYDAQSDRAHSRGASASPGARSDELPGSDDGHALDGDTSVTFSLVQVHGRYESVPVWEEEEDVFDVDEGKGAPREYWDERLVLGSGWLYRQDVQLASLGKEQDVVRRYLDVVDEVIFGGRKEEGGKRGWERRREKLSSKESRDNLRAKNRRVSSGDGQAAGGSRLNPDSGAKRRAVSMGVLDTLQQLSLSEEPEEMEPVGEEEPESVDEDELPEWAKRGAFPGDDLGRAHAMLSVLLPPSLRDALPAPAPRTPLLAGLASGQLLCAAYNAGVRASRRPWGYISADAVHDLRALEAAGRQPGDTGWTFRRADNLRLWAGALKLRYLLPIVTPRAEALVVPPSPGAVPPSPGASSPSTLRFPTAEPPIMFDAKAVAKGEDGWEEMLEALLVRWVERVAEEQRGERSM